MKIVATILVALVVVLSVIDLAVHFGAALRFLLSPSYRRQTRQRWGQASRTAVVGQLTFVLLSFFTVSLVVIAVLWRIFVGPIPPIHEW